MATPIRLPRIVSSPSVIQVHKREPKPFYKPRFNIPKEVRDKTLNQPWLQETDPLMPPYPFGRNQTFREANQGLYGGAMVQSGHNISKGRNKGKTLRLWFPNVRMEKIRSEALDKELHIPITARTLRTITKCGGLDQYLLGDKPARIKELGILGWKLRWLVMNSPTMKKKYAQERRELRIPPKSGVYESFAEVWNDPKRRKLLVDEQTKAWNQLREKAKQMQVLRKGGMMKLGSLKTMSPKDMELPDVIEEVEVKETALPVRQRADV